MSRCFPYPPPYFCEAEIESIKKEKVRLEDEAKRERKREKKEKRKKEKKEKRSGQDHELSKEIKKSLKRKYEELGLVEPKDDKHDSHQHLHKSKKPKDEQLETSGLSEEHGQPCAVRPANFESPERSQDSSKGNSSNMPSPTPSLSNSGSTIRIKLQSRSRNSLPKPQTPQLEPQLTKSRELVPTPQATKNREPVSVPQSSKVKEEFSFLQASKPKTASVLQKPKSVAQTLKPREPVLRTPKSKEPVLDSLVPRAIPVLHAPKAVPKANGSTGLPKSHNAFKSGAGLGPSSSVVRQSASKEPLKTKIEPCARTQIPVEDASQKPKLRDVGVAPAINQDSTLYRSQQVKPKPRDVKAESVPAPKPTPVVQQQVQVFNAKQRVADVSPNGLKQDMRPILSGVPPTSGDEPCFSGRKLEAEEKKESKHHHHHHHHSSSKRSKRKEAEKLFEELITNWKPPVVDLVQVDMGDQDWLMSGAKKRRVETEEGEDEWLSKSSSKSKAGEGLLGHTNGVTGSSYQTWAVHMPELNMYQLPYVVPF